MSPGLAGEGGRGFVTRFAPSPTGRLHLGHAFSALTAWDAAREAGGRFLLRIEDIDATRVRPAFEAAIYEDLDWLGLDWERPVRRQSEHLAEYTAALDRLRAEALIYRCFRTRREVAQAATSAPHGPHTLVRGTSLPPDEEAERLARDEPFAWRLSLDAVRARLGGGFDALVYQDHAAGERPVRSEAAGDVVLARKDVGVAYHLACVVDDALQGVTCVIRGEDLRDAIPAQRLLQALLGMPAPTYRHHRLLAGPDGRRLAKRDGAASLAELRTLGFPPRTVREMAFAAPSTSSRDR